MVTLNEELNLWQQGFQYIAGIDEVGRGPLAGPVVTCALVFPKNIHFITDIDDSKKLSRKKREELFPVILQNALSVSLSIIEENVIDAINIYQATVFGMKNCLDLLKPKPDYVLIDGLTFPYRDYQIKKIIKGDTKVMSIAAASIIAKVTRDRIMELYHKQYPHYQFNKNAGYPTKEHIEALRRYGRISIHRQSFSVKDDTYI